MLKTDLKKFNNAWYDPGASWLKRALWYYINTFFFNSSFPFYTIKFFLLHLFGAKIGKNVVIKPKVNIKYPWKLTIGDNCWIGEEVWIDNLSEVIMGESVTLSQGAL